MSFIATTAETQASGEVAALYRRLRGRGDYLPNYAGLFGHRPRLMAPLAELQEALKAPMPPRLYALVTLAAARATGSSYCALAFARRLTRAHFSEAQLTRILARPETAELPERERAAMALARAVAGDAARVTQADIDRLRDCGFSDSEIFDVVAAAAWRCFFSRIPDALGALPDRALTDLSPALLALLVVGREPEGGTGQRGAESAAGAGQPGDAGEAPSQPPA